MTILFTRFIDETAKNRLKEAGLAVSEINVLTIKTLATASSDILKVVPDFKNIVFTSQHAVRIFFDILSQNQIILPPSVYLFSTSGETKNLIEQYGYSPTLSAPAAEPLAHLMLSKADLSGGVHFIGGTLSLPVLPDILTQNNISVSKIVVYETLFANDANTKLHHITDSFDAIVFFSLSAADAFLVHHRIENPTVVFTLGKTTAEYVRQKTAINTIIVADKPTIESLVDTIVLFVKEAY